MVDRTSAFWRDSGLKIVLFAGATLTVLLYARNAYRSFFLYDDFAIVGMAGQLSVIEIFESAFGGFYRPVGLAFAALEARLFGFDLPAGWSAVSIGLHAANALLVRTLARRLGFSETASWSAGVLFLAAPWHAEAVFWISSLFDLLATLFLLFFLLIGIDLLEEPARKKKRSWGLGISTLALALLAKEMAVTAPALLFVTVVLLAVKKNRRVTGELQRLAPFLVASMVVTASFLFLRSWLLPGLAGAYGDFFSLLVAAPLSTNVWGYLQAVLRPPSAQDTLGRHLELIMAAGFLAATVAVLRWRFALAMTIVTGWLVSLAPVLWSTIPLHGSQNGRYLYGPTIWLTLLLAAGFDACHESIQRTGKGRFALQAGCRLVVIGMLLTSLLSLQHQERIWSLASQLSRHAIESFAPYAEGNRAVFISNLPYNFVEGPYILKSYAFENYYGQDCPPVAAQAWILRATDPPEVVTTRDDPFSKVMPSEKLTLTLDLSRFGPGLEGH